MPLQSNTDAMLPLVLVVNLSLWQEIIQRNEKLPTYHNYTSSDMQPRAYHRVMVPVGLPKSFSMVVSFVSAGETLQHSLEQRTMRQAQVMELGLERGSGLEIESRYLYLEQAMPAEST
jgi:hypothetical protein